MRFPMTKARVFRLLLPFIRQVNQEIESIAILLTVHNCIELLFVKRKQLFNRGRELFH